MKIVIALLLSLVAVSCTSTNGVPDGAVLWCGKFEYKGTWLKTETDGRAMGASDKVTAERLTVDQAVALAEALGCSE
jgi:hypothetical protein